MKKKMGLISAMMMGFFAIVLTLAILNEKASAADITSGDYKYSTNSNGTINITGYTGRTTNLSVPTKIDGKTVVAINKDAFYNCDTLVQVTIPGSIITIGENAFYDCDKLETVKLSKGVKTIERFAFYDCSVLRTVTLNSGLGKIGADAFARCSNIRTISIPSTVTTLGGQAFGHCEALTSITIPASVSSIGFEAFYECTSLNTVVIKNGVTAIENKVFYNCDSLTQITIPGSVATIGEASFYDCDKLETLTLSKGVKSIGRFAFDDCDALKTVNLYSGLKEIGVDAFARCASIKTIAIPSTVTEIGDQAFKSCTSLTAITIPSSVTSIGFEAFYGCDSLANVVFENGLTKLSNNCFSYCPKLVSITLPESITSISSSAFTDTKNFQIKGYKGSYAETYYNSNKATSNLTFFTLPKTVFVNVKELEMIVDETYSIQAKVFPSTSNQTISYTSSDTSVATISSTGVIKAKKFGTTVITAKNDTLTAQCTVTVRFKDVTGSGEKMEYGYKYYFAPVYWAAENGITTGYSDGTFGVGKNCDRKSLMIFLWRVKGCPAPKKSATSYFNDLKTYASTTATNKAIAWAYENGITKGYDDGGFHPNANVTRKDTMIMLYRSAGKPSVTGSLTFSDCKSYSKSSDTYKAILWGANNKITSGYSDGTFGVAKNCLREDIVTFLYRFVNIN